MSIGWASADVLQILLVLGYRSEQYHTGRGRVGQSSPDGAWSFVYVYLAHPNRLISTLKTKSGLWFPFVALSPHQSAHRSAHSGHTVGIRADGPGYTLRPEFPSTSMVIHAGCEVRSR